MSIVIPCYNHENFVQDCIQSVIDQTYENIELIIIDDGSKDNSILKIQEMVEKCLNRFKRFEFRYRPNKGLSATLNEALQWCKGTYFSVIASDDILINYKISRQVYYLESNLEFAGVFGAFQVIDNNGVVINCIKRKNAVYSFEDIFLHKHELPAPTQLIRTHLIKEVGGYAENILIEDWLMWLKISHRNFKFSYLDTIFVKYRRHENNTSKSIEKMIDSRIIIINLFKDNLLYSDALACAYLVSANDYLAVDKIKSWSNYRKFIRLKKNTNYFLSFKYILKLISSFALNKKF